ncbi:hypothetical protein [Salinivibrio sp. YCSC6]|uniref:hypothetical protein n=1 Tax=Salinivibrio sp. YCSC6 TaxID=2003370 RepID=UPI000BBCAA6E|nr:hypothetical protein [Salinivibrio sp. YCSC6]PCE67993.1 hypothetical protein B6G00_06630 [Salinivibrio sp. YCSC6]QCF35112.1 hypothetical protein E8E00_02355 [Salinivibrio sp. YCSC6]
MSDSGNEVCYSKDFFIPPEDWLSWPDEKFNQWRSDNDFPRLVEFFYNALPNFHDWIGEQDEISTSDLVKYGPARFLRNYGCNAVCVEYDNSIGYFMGRHYPPNLLVSFYTVKTERRHTKTIKRKEYTSYLDWAEEKGLFDKDSIKRFLAPSKSTAKNSDLHGSEHYISFNCSPHTAARSHQGLDALPEDSVPSFKILKLGGDEIVEVNGGVLGQKNLEFTNLDNLSLVSPIITSFQSFMFCCMQNFSIEKGVFHAASFYRCAFNMRIDRGGLGECEFDLCGGIIKLHRSSISGSTIKGEAFLFDFDNSEVSNCFFAYKPLLESSPSRELLLNRKVKMMYARQGHFDLAGEHFFKEKRAQRKELWNKFNSDKITYSPKEKLSAMFGSGWMFVKEVYWGYGERPFNVIKSSVFLVLLMSFFNFLSSSSITHFDLLSSFLMALNSYLNIGGEDARYTSDVMRFIDAFMSVLGLLSVGLFVSSLSSKAKNYN